MHRFPGIAAAVITVTAAVTLSAAPPAPAEAIFNDRCSACHSIGGGDMAGPDLIVAKKLPEQKLREAIVRMQENAGPLADREIHDLVEFLEHAEPKQPATANASPAAPVPPPVPAGSVSNGRKLFYGELPLQSRGAACAACHAAAGLGGNLAIDLTAAQARIGDAGVLAVTERPAFPMMKGAYLAHPVTAAEAADLVAFLRSTAATAKPGTLPAAEATLVVHGTAAGVAIVFIAAVAFIFRPRSRGVRALARRERPSRGRRPENDRSEKQPASDARTPN